VPYKSNARSRDSERKRVARKAKQQSIEQPNFKAWFRARVKEIEPEAGRRWEVRLAAESIGGEIDERTLDRHYTEASKRPRAPTAYVMGWALHDVGVDWCSGPVALLAAGYHEEFFMLLGFLATHGLEARSAALRFAFACDRAGAELTTYYDEIVLNKDRLAQVPQAARRKLLARRVDQLETEEKSRFKARAHLRNAAALRDVINQSWTKCRERRTLIDVPDSFQLAHDLISSAKCMKSIRYDGSLAVLSSFSKRYGTWAEQELVRELILVSPIQTVDDIADNILHDSDFVASKTKELVDRAYARDSEGAK